MKKIIFILILTVCLSMNAFVVLANEAEVVKVKVNGLVCDFCSTAITKSFDKTKKVEDVQVDLTEKLITVTLKPNESMDDEAISNTVVNAGYNVVEIIRE